MTRAPRSASCRVANGAAIACSIEMTVIPLRGRSLSPPAFIVPRICEPLVDGDTPCTLRTFAATRGRRTGSAMSQGVEIAGPLRSDVRDGMLIDWDVPIEMDDGIVLRADVYRPETGTAFPVIASYGPYAKGQTFAAGYPRQW